MSNRFDKFTWGNPCACMYKFTDKEQNASNMIRYMFARTQKMFEYENLPDTIPARMLELYLQMNGNCCIAEHENNLYAFVGGLGGEPDVYYMPTVYTVANPALKLSKTYKIDSECIVLFNDSMLTGLYPMFERYASMLAENELSLNLASINSRIVSVISAQDDRTKESAEKYLEDIRNGKQGVIAENEFLEGLKTQPYSNTSMSNAITNLIELEQYIKASWYNELGLNANYNMKRESLNSSENELNNDALLPLVDDMLHMREEGLEKVNTMFGTDISVKLSSSWEDNQEEIELEHRQMKEGDPDDPAEPKED